MSEGNYFRRTCQIFNSTPMFHYSRSKSGAEVSLRGNASEGLLGFQNKLVVRTPKPISPHLLPPTSSSAFVDLYSLLLCCRLFFAVIFENISQNNCDYLFHTRCETRIPRVAIPHISTFFALPYPNTTSSDTSSKNTYWCLWYLDILLVQFVELERWRRLRSR
jgi:hypothetical protein